MLVYQADARIWLREESRRERRPVTLGSLSGSSLDRLSERGFRWLWLRGVWAPREESREAARRRAMDLEAFTEALPDLELDDIDGPLFPVAQHDVRPEMGGDDGLEELRSDLEQRNMGLLLDFSPDLAPGREAAAFAELEKLTAMSDGAAAVFSARDDASAVRERALWREAISRTRRAHPGFVLLLEGEPAPGSPPDLEGFDLALDHGLHASLVSLDADAARRHLEQAFPHGGKLVRFLERHGGARARAAFPGPSSFAAAIVTFAAGGPKLVHDGQLEGFRAAHDPRLGRRAVEEVDGEILAFHERLIEITEQPRAGEGAPCIRPVREAWEGNETFRQLIVFLSGGEGGSAALLSAVNFGPEKAQGYVDLSALDLRGGGWVFQDLFSTEVYLRDGDDLANRGFYLDLQPWDYNIFELRRS